MNTGRRKYELRKRAESQDATRQRIIEAAVALHEQLGPAHTSVSGIAERAGISRPTVYRHFPDERSLFVACTGHYLAQHPPPDPAEWTAILDPENRLRVGLQQIYQWYRETEGMMVVTFRDLPEVPVMGEILAPLFSGFADAHSVLADAWPAPTADLLHAAIGHALAFSTWRSLSRDYGLRDETVADLMSGMVAYSIRWAIGSDAA